MLATRRRFDWVDSGVRGPMRVQLQIYMDLILTAWTLLRCFGDSVQVLYFLIPLRVGPTMMQPWSWLRHHGHRVIISFFLILGTWSILIVCGYVMVSKYFFNVPMVMWCLLIGSVKRFVWGCAGPRPFLKSCLCFGLKLLKHPFIMDGGF